MYAFHATIHALPAKSAPGPAVEWSGRTLATLAIPPELLGTTTFACSFEEAAAALARLERMYCEADGSFVWVSRQGEPLWQIDGNLYDRDERLLFVDIKGNCPAVEFDRLLEAFGWPDTKLVFQLVQAAVFLDEATFREFAEFFTAESQRR